MQPEESKHKLFSQFIHEPQIDVGYGERTWRPVQSIIDLVQNHLDANTVVYEKRLLQLTDTKEYLPEDKEQQQLIVLLNTVKYDQDVKKKKAAFDSLKHAGNITQNFEELQEGLESVNYQKPKVESKLSRGLDSHYVPYDKVSKWSDDWSVVGFRLQDSGTGFDNRLLGMVGASTKKESAGPRGGLGEGLKMSVTHLTRAGADARIISTNLDNQWVAWPEATEGIVEFRGAELENINSETGSITEVDFSKANIDVQARDEVINSLDPRKGEGLAKYVLEFRGEEFIPLIDASCEIASKGVPGGRVYVKGLLVQENANTLASYNLADKWAIKGRDRKTVK